MSGTYDTPAHKLRLTRRQRLWRLIRAVLDPRAWAHLVKLVNYYNYIHVSPLRVMELGPNPAISPTAEFFNPERITIGARVRIGTRSVIWAGPAQGRVIIGDDVLFGPEVMITAAGYRYNDGQPVSDQASDEADVVIGNDVWLGTRVTLLPGTRIGDGAIIGAHSVVRGEIPAMAVAVGSPAKVVGQRQIASS
ncbi:acyltransferase [Tropicibacter sp. S64]|uniref:acyltransferase n=1 Tax=Tropicibacter sp. S64 TaxID=3415122 RepID=UPI003C7A93AE